MSQESYTVAHVGMVVWILPSTGAPAGKLADAEVHFTEGLFAGLKLAGFGVWEMRSGSGRNVTFPARSYTVNGERRSFALLRPSRDAVAATAHEALKGAILSAYQDWVNGQAPAPVTLPAFVPSGLGAAIQVPAGSPMAAPVTTPAGFPSSVGMSSRRQTTVRPAAAAGPVSPF